MAAWPTGSDLTEWLRLSTASVSDEREALFDMIVGATVDAVWADLDPSKMPDQSDPDAMKRCPDGVRLAVIILAARIDSRRQSANGVIASGELFARVSRDDPDYARLIHRYAVSAEP